MIYKLCRKYVFDPNGPAAWLIVLISGLYLCISIYFCIKIIILSVQWPILWMDTYDFLVRPLSTYQNNGELLGWILYSKTEHLHVISRVLSVIGELLFDRPPGSLGIPLGIALQFASLGFLFLIVSRIQTSLLSRLSLFNTSALIILSPWQWENTLWEFQLPWHLVSFIVIVSVSVLQKCSCCTVKSILSPESLWFVFVPPALVLCSGQGLAACCSLSASIILVRPPRYLPILNISSTIASLLLYVSFSSGGPGNPVMFSLPFFVVVSSYSLPIVNGAVLNVISFFILLKSYRSLRFILYPLFAPWFLLISYSLLFSFLVTLARAESGIAMAFSSRYITYSSLLTLGLLLGAGAARAYEGLDIRVLVAFALILVLSSSATVKKQLVYPSPSRWYGAYANNISIYNERVEATKCSLRSAGRAPCALDGTLFSYQYPSSIPNFELYYSGRYPLRGWHKRYSDAFR